MEKVMMGNHAVSYGVQLSRAQVIAAYPITPQTQIVEMLSEMCGDGSLDAEFIKVESEHSVMAATVGASFAGARAFTATSGHGLALMHEVLHWAAGSRLPIVMANVNRALGPGWSVWSEQTDSLAQRDTGWLQIYCETNQEVLDTVIQAFKIAETVNLPVMEAVDQFLPPYEPKFKLDPSEPHAFNGLVTPTDYTELRYKMQGAMERGLAVTQEVGGAFGEAFGRQYDVVEEYRIDDAEIVLVTCSSITSTSRVVVDELRAEGEKVGLLKMRLFRPFPVAAVRDALVNATKVAVVDRNISYGRGGIFASEIKAALYDIRERPVVFPFIIGLGGRDVTPQSIRDIVRYTQEHDAPTEEIIWMEVKR
jgi:pyruvate/2-oxoacid:ferredoxin oxidoreductase alpha subunit